jgi:hypothetical protein
VAGGLSNTKINNHYKPKTKQLEVVPWLMLQLVQTTVHVWHVADKGECIVCQP